MAKRLTMLIVLLSLAGGVLAGTPRHAGSNMMMDCCDKAKSKENSREAEMARQCCATNCSTTVPTSSVASFNFAPANFTISKSIAEQIAALFAEEKSIPVSPSYDSHEILARTVRPRYIQHNSFLI